MADNVFQRVIHLTKGQAAYRHIDAAIDAFDLGNYDIAITLAAAAEGMAPKEDERGLFQKLLNNPNRPVENKKLWNEKLNATRNWLKHPTDHLAHCRDIAALEAAFFILRALDRIEPWSDKMQAFKEFYFSAPNPLRDSGQ